MSNNKGWYQLHTVEDVRVAKEKGHPVEYTYDPKDRIDMPAWNEGGSGAWVDVDPDQVVPSHFENGDKLRAYGELPSTPVISPIAYQQYRESLNSAIEDGGLPAWVVSLLEEGRDYLDVLATKNFTFRED